MTAVDEATALVETVNVAVVAPAGTVTLEGTPAVAVLLLESVTCAPPAGAGPLNVTMPVEGCVPPTTFAGFSEREDREIDTRAGDASKSNTAGLGSLKEIATNLEGEII